MQQAEFLKIASEGENERVEFKARVKAKDMEYVVREVVAFANADGGVILFGVSDNGELLGLSPSIADHFTAAMFRAARSLPVDVRIEVLEIESRVFVAVSVPAAPDSVKPVMTAHGQAFIREGTSVVPLPGFRSTPGENSGKQTEKLRMFVAMSFRFEEEPALVDYYEAMVRATKASEVPVELVRMDLEEGDYEITTEIIDRIAECDIVLADFTLNSPNVYFEAGVAVGSKKRLIRTARKDTVMAFDIRTYKIILYANATQLESALPGAIKAAYDFVLRERKLAAYEK